MTFLLLALRWAGGILKAIPWQLFAAVGALAGCWLLWSAHTHAVSQARSDGFTAGRADATTTFVAAQAEAARIATIDKQAKEAQYEIAREQGAAAYADLSGRYRAAVLRLATKADSRSAGQADLRGYTESAGLPEGTPGSTFVSISRPDALICADNTAYSIGAFEYASRLEKPQ